MNEQERKELIINLPNGNTLRCGQGTEHEWGGDVKLCDPNGNELMYWDSDEWRDDPELVMGAIFVAAVTGEIPVQPIHEGIGENGEIGVYPT